MLEIGKTKQTDMLDSKERHHRFFEEPRVVSHVGVLPVPALQLARMQPVGVSGLRPEQIQDQMHRVCLGVAPVILVGVNESQQVLKG